MLDLNRAEDVPNARGHERTRFQVIDKTIVQILIADWIAARLEASAMPTQAKMAPLRA